MLEKISMLETKQGQFWNLPQIPLKVNKRYFSFSSYFADGTRKKNKKVFFTKILKKMK